MAMVSGASVQTRARKWDPGLMGLSSRLCLFLRVAIHCGDSCFSYSKIHAKQPDASGIASLGEFGGLEAVLDVIPMILRRPCRLGCGRLCSTIATRPQEQRWMFTWIRQAVDVEGPSRAQRT